MNGHWCDQAEIMESIAARGHPRGCYDVMAWCDQADCIIYRHSRAPKLMHACLVRPGKDCGT